MNVSFTDIKSINCLAECRLLTHLKLVKTAIDDLKVLRECGDNLLTLDVRHTPLLTLEDAAGCCKLRTLDVESIDCFDDHTSLRLIRNDLSKLSKSDVTDWLMKAKARYEAADKGEELCKVGPGRTRLIFFAAALGDLDTMTDLLDEGARRLVGQRPVLPHLPRVRPWASARSQQLRGAGRPSRLGWAPAGSTGSRCATSCPCSAPSCGS